MTETISKYMWRFLKIYEALPKFSSKPHKLSPPESTTYIFYQVPHGDTSSNPGWDWLHFT